jgi:hypothetical protein
MEKRDLERTSLIDNSKTPFGVFEILSQKNI